MSFIKFPTQIKPSRVTVQLERSDELFVSPVTGIQQVASRGNAFWRWSYEFKDLSLSERETVQAFLMKCRGSLNTFNVTDPANYELRGTLSGFIDLFSGRGQFVADAGSGAVSNAINSYWNKQGTVVDHHISDDQLLNLWWRSPTAVNGPRWRDQATMNDSMEDGAMYVARIKHFQNERIGVHGMSLRVGSGSANYLIATGPGQSSCKSTDMISLPFLVSDVGSMDVDVVDWANTDGFPGDDWKYADFRLSRCALISNSENLFQYSNDFAQTEWTKTRCSVASGFGERNPGNVNSSAWKLFADTSSDTHYISQSITKSMTEDLYCLSVYARQSERLTLRLTMAGATATDNVGVYFRLNDGTMFLKTVGGTFTRASASMVDVGSDWWRCAVTVLVNSDNILWGRVWPANSAGAAYPGNGSDGIEIYGAQMRKHPYKGHYVPTTDTTVVGTGWQTGSEVYIDGLDPLTQIKAGTRCEIITQYHDRTAGTFEKSEFKKITEEVVVKPEGWAVLPIDPPLRNAPETTRSYLAGDHLGETIHNAVVFKDPEMRSRLIGGTVQYIEKPLQLTDIVFDVIEDLAE